VLGNRCFVGTRVPIEDGVDGAGVYASSFGEMFSSRLPIAQGVESKHTGVWTIFERHFGGLCMVFKVFLFSVVRVFDTVARPFYYVLGSSASVHYALFNLSIFSA